MFNIFYRLLFLTVLFLSVSPGNAEPLIPQTGFLMDTAPQESAVNPFDISAEVFPDKIGPGLTGTVKVVFSISAGYKIYADTASVRPDEIQGLEFGTVKVPPAIEKKEPDGKTARFYENQAVFELPVRITSQASPGPVSIPLNIAYQGCSDTRCFFPEKKSIHVNFSIESAGLISETQEAEIISTEEKTGENSADIYQKAASRFGLAGVLAAAFVWGLLASLTPCIYPMIPVTVSVIGASNSGSVFQGFILSLFYILGMSLTYAAFGVGAAWSGSLFGAYTSHPAIRIIVAGIFIILALGMFDMIHIQVPSAVSSGLGRYTGKGKIGVFLTGAAAGFLVGPCVGPMLVGLLVYIAALGSKIQGFLIMWSFALGMGMLFLLIGTFSGAAASLPRSGMWMVKIKYFFGVLMLGAALWYIEPVLPGNIFSLCLGALLIGTGIFIGGLDPITTETGRKGRFWKALGILCLTLGIAYSARFALTDFMPAPEPFALYEETGIQWYGDESEGLAAAVLENKPVMIDFSADWCTACKKLENETFAHADIIDMADNFISIKIDCTDPHRPEIKNLQKKYGVVGLPAIIFLDSSGEIIKELSVTEFVNPDVFREKMSMAISS